MDLKTWKRCRTVESPSGVPSWPSRFRSSVMYSITLSQSAISNGVFSSALSQSDQTAVYARLVFGVRIDKNFCTRLSTRTLKTG